MCSSCKHVPLAMVGQRIHLCKDPPVCFLSSLSSRSILGIKPSFSMTYRQFWGHRQEDRGDKQTQIREMRKACSPVFTFVLVTLWVCALFISPSICFFISILFFCPLDFGSPDFYLKKKRKWWFCLLLLCLPQGPLSTITGSSNPT